MVSEETYLNTSLRKIAKGAGIGFTGTIIGVAFGFISRIIIARFLGAGDYGLISLGFAAMSVAVVLSRIGFQSGIERYIPFYMGKGDMGRVKGTILSTLKINFPLSLLLAFIFFFKANWISVNVFHATELTTVLRIFSVGIPFMVLAMNFISATVGFQDLRYRVYVKDIFHNVVKLLFIVISVMLGYGVVGAAWGWVLAIVFMPFLAFYFLEKRVFPILISNVKAVSVDKKLLAFSLPLVFSGVAEIMMNWMDTLMLGYFSTVDNVGIYNACLPTARLLRFFITPFGAIFMPVVSELYSKNAMEDLTNIYSSVTKWILMLVLPAFLLLTFFSEWILKLLFGSEYVAGSTALTILSVGFLITCIVGPTGGILKTYGRTGLLLSSSLVFGVLNFLLNYLLIPIYGVNGAALATGSSLAGLNVTHLFFGYRIAGIQPFRLSYFKPLLASLISVSIIYIIAKYLEGISLFSLLLLILTFLAFYFFLLLLFKSFEEEDLIILKAIDRKLGIKSGWFRKLIKKFL